MPDRTRSSHHQTLLNDSFLWGLLLVFVALCAIKPSIGHAQPQGKTYRVLYINSYSRGYSWSDDIEQGLRERLGKSGQDIELSVEYLDTQRFPEPSLQSRHAEMLRAKFGAFRQDLIIVSDNAAFEFATHYRSRLFPDIPMVFCGYNDFRPDRLHGLTNITGINEELDLQGLVETALSIQPELRTLVFILSTEDVSGRANAEKVKDAVIPGYKERYEIFVLEDAPMRQISERLSGLPDNAAVFILGHARETVDGRAISPVENSRIISAASPVPAYGLWRFHLGTGVLGGRILSGYDQGNAAGLMALEILGGKSADAIPVLMQSPVQTIFDFTVMRRFHIPSDALPAGSVLINKPTSYYDEHKKALWIVLTIFTTLMAFIVILSLNIFKRIRAEKALQEHRDLLEATVKERTVELRTSNSALVESEERFRCLSDAAFEGILIIEDGAIIEINEACLLMFGYDRKDVLNQPAIAFIALEDREDVNGKIMSGYEQPYMANGLKKDGSEFPIEIQGKNFAYRGRTVRVSAIRDLTRQRQAEEEIKVLRGILPICAFCKKIKDDKGHWEQVDIYISRHSGVDPSHSVCPECAAKHYPEFYRPMGPNGDDEN